MKKIDKKILIIGSFFAIYLMLAMPGISAVNAETVKEHKIEAKSYCPFIHNLINFILGLIGFLAAIKGFYNAGIFKMIKESLIDWFEEIFQPTI